MSSADLGETRSLNCDVDKGHATGVPETGGVGLINQLQRKGVR
jgi:hypothetical protein